MYVMYNIDNVVEQCYSGSNGWCTDV